MNEANENRLSRLDQLLLKEYELSQEMHNYYGRMIWEIGAIFIGGGTATIALIVSRVVAPSGTAALGSWAVTLLMIIYYLKVRRTRDIAEIHLRRCREIERELGLLQHRYVSRGGTPNGVTINDGTVPGRTDQRIRLHYPTGWATTQYLTVGLAILSYVVGIHFVWPLEIPQLISVTLGSVCIVVGISYVWKQLMHLLT